MTNILAIGAHFDDVELGCSGTLAKHIANGDKVFIFVATKSGFGGSTGQDVRSNEIALQEGQKAAEILGAKLICGNFKTMYLEFQDELNLDLLNVITDNHIDTIYTHWYGDIHHDHSALSKATMHAGRHIPRILMYRSNWYQSVYDFKGNFHVDITDYWHIKEQVIKAHKSEYERVGSAWLEFFKNEAENAGKKIGVPMAEVFEVVKWLQ